MILDNENEDVGVEASSDEAEKAEGDSEDGSEDEENGDESGEENA